MLSVLNWYSQVDIYLVISCPLFIPSLPPSPVDYMVIEDLTANYRCPVILDLKIGTRQYGDDVSEEKKQLHIARCAHSTSNKLGVRICGMQVGGVYQCRWEWLVLVG